MFWLILSFLIIIIAIVVSIFIWRSFPNVGRLSNLLFKIDINNNLIIIYTLQDRKYNYYFQSLAIIFNKRITADGVLTITWIEFLKLNLTTSTSLLNNFLKTLKNFHNTKPKINSQHQFNIHFKNTTKWKFPIKFKMILFNYEPVQQILYGKLTHHLSFYHKEFDNNYKSKIINYDINQKIINIALLKNQNSGIVFYLNFNRYLLKLVGKQTGMISIIKNIIFEVLTKKGFIITNENNLEFYIFKFGNLKFISVKKIMKKEFKKCYRDISKSLVFNLPFECGAAYIRNIKKTNNIISAKRKAKFSYNELLENNINWGMSKKINSHFHYKIFNVRKDENSFKRFTSSYLTFSTALQKANFILRSEPIINNDKSILIGNLIDILPVENIAIFKEKNLSRQIKYYGLTSLYDVFTLHKLKDHLKKVQNNETYVIRIFAWTLLNNIEEITSPKDRYFNNRIIILINDFEKLSINQMFIIQKRLVDTGYKIALYNVYDYEISEKFIVFIKPELIFMSRRLISGISNNAENKTKILSFKKLLQNENGAIIINQPDNSEDSLFLTNFGFKNWIS